MVKHGGYHHTRMSRDRSEGGRFIEKASLDDVVAVLREADEPVTGTELGKRLDISNRTALDKLNELHDRGIVERKEVGARAVVWWLDPERDHTTADIESAADRVGGRGLFADADGEAFADAVEASREEVAQGYEDRHDDLFG